MTSFIWFIIALIIGVPILVFVIGVVLEVIAELRSGEAP
jgi:hypothetical protein